MQFYKIQGEWVKESEQEGGKETLQYLNHVEVIRPENLRKNKRRFAKRNKNTNNG